MYAGSKVEVKCEFSKRKRQNIYIQSSKGSTSGNDGEWKGIERGYSQSPKIVNHTRENYPPPVWGVILGDRRLGFVWYQIKDILCKIEASPPEWRLNIISIVFMYFYILPSLFIFHKINAKCYLHYYLITLKFAYLK